MIFDRLGHRATGFAGTDDDGAARGWGGRCEAKHFEGKAAPTAASNMLRSSERGSIAITICTSR